MTVKRGFFRATVCGASLIAAGALTSISDSAFAACGTGGQCSVTGGFSSGQSFSGGDYWATDLWYNSIRLFTGAPALHAVNPGSFIEATDITIQPRTWNTWFGTFRQGYSSYKAQAENGGSIHLIRATLSDGLNGILATGINSQITMTGGSINVLENAATVRNSSSLHFNGGVAIAVTGDSSIGVAAYDAAKVSFQDGFIEASGLRSQAVRSEGQASVTIEDSTIHATGDDSLAFIFGGTSGMPGTPGSTVNMLGGTVVASPQATAIGAQGRNLAHQFNLDNVVVEGGNRLIDAQAMSSLVLNAVSSTLSGSARTGTNANFSMNLQDSIWTIRHDTAGNGNSSISKLDFNNSIIRFDAPVGGVFGIYQSLRVGAGNPGTLDVYNIGANSHIEMNSFINAGGVYSNQYADQLLIDGNVGGKTLLKIHEMVGSTGAATSLYGTNAAHEGISLVQVSGLAQPDSFYLEGDYMTLKGKPYVHRIYAFGPGSAHGTADRGQQRVGGTSHWDYRLQNEFIRNRHGWAVQVVPQVSSYLTAPTALFQSGFMDVGNLHSRLGEWRQAPTGIETLGSEEQPNKARGNFFLRGYGGDYDYRSDLSSIRYGYDADIRYAAVQAGGSLYGFDTASGQMMFGLAGSYGDLSFSPHRVDSHKTSMDVWSASAYASWLGTNGFYLDTILAYGGFSGTVSTARYGRTARLKGNSFTASVEMGKNFAIGSDGWSIEPQAQLTYQRLSFDRAHDVDDFAIVLGSPDQWIGRIGGKLSKEVAVENIERLVLYGKLNLIHGFGDGDRVFLGDLEMTKNAALYGDVTYQGRIGDGGSNGFSLNGGLRFQF